MLPGSGHRNHRCRWAWQAGDRLETPGAAALQASADAILAPAPVPYGVRLEELGRQGITSCVAVDDPDLAETLLAQRVVDKIVTGENRSVPAGFVVHHEEHDPTPYCILYPRDRKP